MPSTNFGGFGFKVNATVRVCALGLIFSSSNVQAQVVSDGTTNSQVNVAENISTITGGIQAGQNLFHSFEQFSLATGSIANFDHALEISNIFSRITGGSISEIDGLIKSSGNANLFLLNPAGIIFGANAQLDVGGSFIATTSDLIVFEDGTEFSAVTPDTEPLLTISSPIGLQYGSTPNAISVLPNAKRSPNQLSSGLSIKPENTLALIGGDVSLTRNSLNAIGGNIELGSIKVGKVDIQAKDNGWQFNYENAEELGNIDLIDRALINSSGVVNVQGKEINLSVSSGVRNFTDINGEGGIINLQAAESITLDGSFLFTQVGQLRSDLNQAIAGSGGDILIKAPQVLFTNSSFVSAGTLSSGAGGDITIDAPEVVELSSKDGNSPSILSTSTQGLGEGGELKVNTRKLIIKDGSQIQALAGEGAGGTISINATESVKLSGKGILRSRNLQGNISETELESGLSASSGNENLPFELQPKGKSGNLVINTPDLNIQNEAQISVSSFGTADAGDIEINTSTLNVDTAGKIVANTASGAGGSINLRADQSVILNNQGEISTTAQNGDGGNIGITTDNLVLLDANSISADAQQGSGGKIKINTLGFFIDPSSSITASSEVDTNEGVVEIITPDINSKIQTQEQEQSPLVAENYIATGCSVGQDFVKNQFRNIGRGGISGNLMEGTVSEETLSDLGDNTYSKLPNVAEKANNNLTIDLSLKYQPITEATNWMINDQGKVELVAQSANLSVLATSACLFAP
jgi:filamentous hemagglutinin family protein